MMMHGLANFKRKIYSYFLSFFPPLFLSLTSSTYSL